VSVPIPSVPGVAALRDGVAHHELTPGEIVADALARYRTWEEGDRPLNAFLAADLDAAAEGAERLAAGLDDDPEKVPPLAGVPIALKDNLVTTDLPTTCGSRLLEGYRSPYEATVVRRLREAGAIVVGKTNMDEFAMGSSTERSAFGPTLNPVDRDRVPGGSSGGSAAAVAAGIVPAALGSSTGGSVRQPAAFCGVVGIEPTYGRVSRHGLVAHASSLDRVGVFGRTVDDAARVLEVIAGHDPRDSTSADREVPRLLLRSDDDLSGMAIGIPEEYLDGLQPGVRDRFREALGHLEALGAELREVSLPHTRYALAAYYVLATAEASSDLARFDGMLYGRRVAGADYRDTVERTRALMGAEVRRRMMLGTFVLSAGYQDGHYERAQRARARVTQDFRHVFDSGVDLVFAPTTPGRAFRLGERTRDSYLMYSSDTFTVPASLAGIPSISLPIGRVEGLPVGGQLIAPRWQEPEMVRCAAALERAVLSARQGDA
jgi:aspartyl-tRNA(Asn)/glutamyl-tRNA(Gln) amidotransferase subunit A